MEVPTTPSTSTLDRNHRIIPSPDGHGHVYSDGFAHDGMEPYVKITVKDIDSVSMLAITPACARELALQLIDSAAFCDQVARA